MTSTEIPADFQPLNSKSPFNILVGPFFACLDNDQICIGVRLEEKHCNTTGRLHGAMVDAIFDVVLGHNVGLSIAKDNGEDLTQFAAGVPGAPILTTSLTTTTWGQPLAGIGLRPLQ